MLTCSSDSSTVLLRNCAEVGSIAGHYAKLDFILCLGHWAFEGVVVVVQRWMNSCSVLQF
uniref:Uncharacterized protein n=1 Tax=Physcomitrium patens TaxID=3218 RepID=A0A2K1JRL8_PHYPA|nr:hypothetical protein PHYPA_016564 [Physcomitrium patens]